MTPEQFAYWMQGFAELSPSPPNQEQWNSIRLHLIEVFHKITPPSPLDKATDSQEQIGGDELVKAFAEEIGQRRMEQPLWPSVVFGRPRQATTQASAPPSFTAK